MPSASPGNDTRHGAIYPRGFPRREENLGPKELNVLRASSFGRLIHEQANVSTHSLVRSTAIRETECGRHMVGVFVQPTNRPTDRPTNHPLVPQGAIFARKFIYLPRDRLPRHVCMRERVCQLCRTVSRFLRILLSRDEPTRDISDTNKNKQTNISFFSNFFETTLLSLKLKKRGVTIELFDENLRTDTSLAVWRAEV